MPQLSRGRARWTSPRSRAGPGRGLRMRRFKPRCRSVCARDRAGIGKYADLPAGCGAVDRRCGGRHGLCASPLLSKLGISPHGVLQFHLWNRAQRVRSATRAAERRGASLRAPRFIERGARGRGRAIGKKGRREIRARTARDESPWAGTAGFQLSRRDQALQADRDHRHRKKHRHSGDPGERARPRRPRRHRRSRRRVSASDSTIRARGDVVLNPFEQRSVKWDLFGEIKNLYDVDQLARSLIPDHEGQDRSWRGYATDILQRRRPGRRMKRGIDDVGELYRLSGRGGSPSELRTLVKGTPAQPFLDEHNSRMFDSIRSVTSSAVGAIELRRAAERDEVFHPRLGEQRFAGQSVHSLQSGSDRRIAHPYLGVDAHRHF